MDKGSAAVLGCAPKDLKHLLILLALLARCASANLSFTQAWVETVDDNSSRGDRERRCNVPHGQDLVEFAK
jgi:hypothetical protein